MMEKGDGRLLEPVKDSPVQPGEVVVGTVSEDAYRLYALSMEIDDKGMRLVMSTLSRIIESGQPPDEATANAVSAEFDELKYNAKATLDLFWTAARHELNIYDSDVGIRNGNAIVRLPDPSGIEAIVLGL